MSAAASPHRQDALPLAERQQALLVQSALLRGELARELQPLRRPLAAADRVCAGWQWLRARPELVLAALAALAALAGLAIVRPRRALRLGTRLWWGWRQWRHLQRWLQAGP